MVIKINKKAQISLFIIIAILLVAGIILFLLIKDVDIPFGPRGEKNPNSFLESCLEDKIRNSSELISQQGGYIQPTFYKDFSFSEEDFVRKISYLCYNSNKYLPCINLEPLLIQHLKEEISNEISDDVEICFDSLVESLEEEGYSVNSEYNGFKVNFREGKIIIDVNGKLILIKNEESEKKENFTAIFSSNLYDIAIVVQEIISQEAKYCNFDALGYMLLHPVFKISKIKTSDLERIYIVESRDTKEKFIFVVRSCVIPPGI
jgi:hypothetical protein